MNSSKIISAGIALALLCFMAGSPTSARGGQRRVLTNDDVSSTSPEPEKAAEPSAGSTAASPATSDASADASALQAQLGQLTNIVETLGQASDILSDKINAGGADEATLARWSGMRDSLANLLGEFRSFADQARAAAPAAQPQLESQSQQSPREESGGEQEPNAIPAAAQ